MLLRLEPGDPGYTGWALALDEFFAAVLDTLQLYEGVEEEIERRNDADSDDSEQEEVEIEEDIRRMVDLLERYPVRPRLL